MKVFVTGASGHIASAVIPELITAGHAVTGLARSDAAAARVEALGAEVRRGDLGDRDALTAAADEADGVIHLAFDHAAQGAGNLAGAAATDLLAVQSIGAALAGTGKPFVSTNATGGICLAGFTGLLTEDDVLPGGPRVDAENVTISLASQGVRSSVVRLPPAVHGDGRYGFVSGLIDTARATGRAGYCGDGGNRWGSADTHDVAVVYRIALESAPAGARLHAVAEEGIPLRRIAETIARRLGVPVSPTSAEEAEKRFGYLTPFVAMDNPASSRVTRTSLGWAPSGTGLIESLEQDPALVASAG
ncbi:NAD(P)H-binding protein [Streptomyces sp. SID8358]|uniref:SDR family oxidoreductase n=1 Tax=Streptomyces sp. SID8358 TaxID=2690342 RepID=UPI000DACC55F|nr:SDR family oxidoreductase [Streptomyces sp. SID8358]MYU35360.1 NAD(P)H-binding protein [Streptomyces sp. SID8358]